VSLYLDNGDVMVALQKYRRIVEEKTQKAKAATLASITITMPNGSTTTKTFESSQTLWAVYQFIATHAQSWNNRNFSISKLAQGESQQRYNETEYDKTLKACGLFPLGELKASVV
jgi:hypothetical protein